LPDITIPPFITAQNVSTSASLPDGASQPPSNNARSLDVPPDVPRGAGAVKSLVDLLNKIKPVQGEYLLRQGEQADLGLPLERIPTGRIIDSGRLDKLNPDQPGSVLEQIPNNSPTYMPEEPGITRQWIPNSPPFDLPGPGEPMDKLP
jgi:hypothetical protein